MNQSKLVVVTRGGSRKASKAIYNNTRVSTVQKSKFRFNVVQVLGLFIKKVFSFLKHYSGLKLMWVCGTENFSIENEKKKLFFSFYISLRSLIYNIEEARVLSIWIHSTRSTPSLIKICFLFVFIKTKKHRQIVCVCSGVCVCHFESSKNAKINSFNPKD